MEATAECILQWKIFWEKEEEKLEKWLLKFSTFYVKYVQFVKFEQKTSILSDHENAVFMLIHKIIPKI